MTELNYTAYWLDKCLGYFVTYEEAQKCIDEWLSICDGENGKNPNNYQIKKNLNKEEDEFFKEYSTMIQDIKIPSGFLLREEINELGRKCPYSRYVKFPINTTALDHPFFYGLKIVRGL